VEWVHTDDAGQKKPLQIQFEGLHGVMKIKARRLNLFSGQPSKRSSMLRKIQELVFPINHLHYYGDCPFVFFLHLLAVYYPCCSDDNLEERLSFNFP